jgi:hypothetical protein
MEEANAGERVLYEIVAEDEPFCNAEETTSTETRIAPEETLHNADESEIHLDVSHAQPEKENDCVEETTPKREPITVKDTEPVLAALKA